MAEDGLRQQAHADAIVARAAEQLRGVLEELARAVDPFPVFPGTFFSYGIEVPLDDLGGPHGCVVLGEDGALHELRLGLDVAEADSSDPAGLRAEERVPLEGLEPALFVLYAQRAVRAAVAELEARAG
jgi:hypothetical protein